MSRKLALIIGNSEYDDANLARLKAPEADVRAFAELLRDPDIGGFETVETLFNHPFAEVHPAVADFFADKRPDDLLLLYFSGHGVLDPQGRLYLGLKNTRRERLSGSAIASTFIKDEMDNSRSKRQVLILDCCHSGAFARGAKGAVGAQAITNATFEGHGRVVLTATDITQHAWEGDQVIGETENSLFTHFMIEGLKTGAADIDGDGRITPDELYEYVFGKIVSATSKQKPRKIVYDQQGELILARNIHRRLAELPLQLREAVESPLADVREGAVRGLERLLTSSLPDLALAARETLQRLAEDDSHRVSSAANQALTEHTKTQREKAHLRTGAEQRVGREDSAGTQFSRSKEETPMWITLSATPTAWLIGHFAGFAFVGLSLTALIIVGTVGGAVSIVLITWLGLSVTGLGSNIQRSKLIRIAGYFLLAGLLGGFVGLALWLLGCGFQPASLIRQTIGCSDTSKTAWKLLSGFGSLIGLAGACTLMLVEFGITKIWDLFTKRR